jgi:Arc/MetJ-type ribon-helix-helix transcriptional regulator
MVSDSLSPEVKELIAFHMQTGKYDSQNDLFREALATLTDRDADLEAIREGIADMEAGRTQPLSVVAAEIAHKYGFEPK